MSELNPDFVLQQDYTKDFNRPFGIDERLLSIVTVFAIAAFVLSTLHAHSVPLIAAELLAAAFVMDALSYLIHYTLDNNTFKGKGPFEKFAYEFQIHHHFPGDVINRGWMRNNTFELSIYFSIPMCLLGFIFSLLHIPALQLLFNLVGLYGCFIPTIHAWSHQGRSCPGFVIFLQKSKIILSPREHAKHHAGRSSQFRAYALFNGWSNYLMDLFFSGDPRNKTHK